MKDIHARVPVNRTAALAVSEAADYELTEMKPANQWDSAMPYVISTCPPGVANLKGIKWGRIEVLGWYETRRNKNGRSVLQRWVVRCACGMYSIRTSTAIKNRKNPDECCSRCQYLKIIRKRAAGVGK